LAKLVEEAEELRAASAEDVTSELVDLLEVVRALATEHGCALGARPRCGRTEGKRAGRVRRPVFLDSIDAEQP